jgi:hypothetical protein
VDQSPLVQNKEALKKDGWGGDYEVRTVEVDGNQEIQVTSRRYDEYKQNNSTMFK